MYTPTEPSVIGMVVAVIVGVSSTITKSSAVGVTYTLVPTAVRPYRPNAGLATYPRSTASTVPATLTVCRSNACVSVSNTPNMMRVIEESQP